VRSLNGIEPVTAIIVQARLGSTRLPGKVLEPIVDGESVLGFLLRRLRMCGKAQRLIVATSDTRTDDRLADWLKERNWNYVRGSEPDCLRRFTDAAREVSADVVVRITADCPLVLPEVVDRMLVYYLRNSAAVDYLSNRQYTDFPEGVDVEIMRRGMLEEAVEKATEPREREHINYYFLSRDERFRIRYYCHGVGWDYSRFKLSIDRREELERVRALFSKYGLPQNFTLAQLFAVLNRYEPELATGVPS
jgi:spore coat polysaccharide biosynthesis protein SpsF